MIERLSRVARSLSIPLVAGLAVTGIVFGIKELGWLEPIELAAYDQATRLRPTEPTDPRILVVGISEKDILKYNFPIPDQILNSALQKLIDGDAAVVGVDLVKDLAKGELLKTFQGENQVIAVCSHGGKSEDPTKSPPGVEEVKVGYVDLPVDRDGIVRRSSLFATGNDPNSACLAKDSLAIVMARSYLEFVKKIEPQFAGETYQFGKVAIPNIPANFGGYQKSEIGGYPVLIKYRHPSKAFELVTLSDLIDGKVSKTALY
jgi:adenylate cyclase